MNGNGSTASSERLTLQGRLSELPQLPHWLERLAAQHAIPPNLQFAMDLCLEEAVSNIIRHGYASGEKNGSVQIEFLHPRENSFLFVLEDQAPHFNPLILPDAPLDHLVNATRVGGHGIGLLRKFADALEYQALPSGNRLTIRFATVGNAVSKK